MSRLGANVTELMPRKNIDVAKIHAKGNLKIKYICSSPENYK